VSVRRLMDGSPDQTTARPARTPFSKTLAGAMTIGASIGAFLGIFGLMWLYETGLHPLLILTGAPLFGGALAGMLHLTPRIEKWNARIGKLWPPLSLSLAGIVVGVAAAAVGAIPLRQVWWGALVGPLLLGALLLEAIGHSDSKASWWIVALLFVGAIAAVLFLN
jgi:hypothetical protein